MDHRWYVRFENTQVTIIKPELLLAVLDAEKKIFLDSMRVSQNTGNGLIENYLLWASITKLTLTKVLQLFK